MCITFDHSTCGFRVSVYMFRLYTRWNKMIIALLLIVSMNHVTGSETGKTQPSIAQADVFIGDGLRTWPGATVPINYTPEELFGVPTYKKKNLDDAVAAFSTYTCINIVDRTAESDYVNLITEDDCSTPRGMAGGAQFMHICLCDLRTPLHLFMRVLGLNYTTSRADRDDFISIHTENVRPDSLDVFSQVTNALHDVLPYDYKSLMHFDQYAFSDHGNVTINTDEPSYQNIIGNSPIFSFGDLRLLHLLYNCSAHCDDSIVCGEDEYKGKDCMCYCSSDDVNVPAVICDVQPTPKTTTPMPTTTTTMPTTTTTMPTTTTTMPTTTTTMPTTTTTMPTTTTTMSTTTTTMPTTTTTTPAPQNQCTGLKKPCGCKDNGSVNNCDILENSECKNKKDFCKCKPGFKPNSDNTGCELPECKTVGRKTCICKEGKKCAGIKRTVCKKRRNGGFKCQCNKGFEFRNEKCKCKKGFKLKNGKCKRK